MKLQRVYQRMVNALGRDSQLMIEKPPVDAQFKLLRIHRVVNNACLGLDRQRQLGFEIDDCAQLAFDNIEAEQEQVVRSDGVGRVKVVEFVELAFSRPDAPTAIVAMLD